MKKMPISLLCGFASIIVTTILYFIILGNIFLELICFITLLGVVFAECVTTALAFFSKGDPRKVAAAGISAIMIPLSVVLSAVYIVNFPDGYATYAAWYSVFFIIVMVIAVILFTKKEDKSFQNAKNNMLYMRKIVKCIMIDPAAENYKNELRAIEEKLHFLNDTVIISDDEKILAMLNDLKDNIASPEFDVSASIEKLNKAIDTRKIMSSRNV